MYNKLILSSIGLGGNHRARIILDLGIQPQLGHHVEPLLTKGGVRVVPVIPCQVLSQPDNPAAGIVCSPAADHLQQRSNTGIVLVLELKPELIDKVGDENAPIFYKIH